MAADDTPADPDEPSPFRAVAEHDATAMDLYEEAAQNWVIAPLKVLWSDYRGRIGILILIFYVLMGTVGVVLWPQPQVGGPIFVQPFEDPSHPLGTDGIGQDLLGLMIHATPDMFKMIIAGALFGNALGVVFGMVAGYSGGNIDKALMTWSDTIGSIPRIPLLLILAAIIEPTNPYLIGIMLNIQGWTAGSRGLRAQTLALRDKEHVEAGKALGQPTSMTLMKEILPELLPLITIGFFTGAVGIINASVALYFLGILPFTANNWGIVLNEAYFGSGSLVSLEAAHWLAVPLLTITMLNFAVVMLAQAFDQVWNPRVRARHLGRKRRAEADEEVDESNTAADLGMGMS